MTGTLCMIILLPFLAFLANGILGRKLGHAGGWLAFAAMATGAVASTILLVNAWAGALTLPHDTGALWNWIQIGGLNLSVGLHYDQLTAIMCFVVTFVGSLVFLYAIGYMHDDPGFNRFFAYLSLFAFSMLVLVLGDSFPLVFVGWEGVGLCSYLLIGYYLDMPGAADAGKKAFIVNRVGDAGFLVAIFIIFGQFGTLNIAEVMHAAVEGPKALAYAGGTVTLLTLAMFLGCTGKSAQIPLFVWLPDAMAGPTPVSALIHAATMVTAGVYLVARSSVLFALAPDTMRVVAIIGCATAFVAGVAALTQRDIKKVLAYSTVSQLGYMFLACGVGAFAAGMFHVVTHAFFKACLFLGAGAAIHALHGQQDLFEMGGLRKKIPNVAIPFGLSCLAIAGFPLTSGFFSKDEILWQTLSTGHPILYFFAAVTALMTCVYSMRAYLLAFEGEPRMSPHAQHHIHHPHWTMALVLAVLAGGAMVVGFFNVPHGLAHTFLGVEGASFEHFLSPVLEHAEEVLHAHAGPAFISGAGAELGLTVFSILMVFAGLAISARLFMKSWPAGPEALRKRFNFAYQISFGKWWIDDAYNLVFGGGARLLGAASVAFDQYIVDGVLKSVAGAARGLGGFIRRVQSAGQVQAYALAILLGANILILVVLIYS